MTSPVKKKAKIICSEGDWDIHFDTQGNGVFVHKHTGHFANTDPEKKDIEDRYK